MKKTEDWDKVLRALEALPAPCTLNALVALLVTSHAWSDEGARNTVETFAADGRLIISGDLMVHRPPTAPTNDWPPTSSQGEGDPTGPTR